MAYARKKKFWAPGHGNLHVVLESYTLCKDGNWHLLDTYNQKQPPFVMPLQVRVPLCLPVVITHRGSCQTHVKEVACQQMMLNALTSRVEDSRERHCGGVQSAAVCVQNMQSSSATYESILPGSNSMRLAGTALPGMPSELGTSATPQLTSAEAKKV